MSANVWFADHRDRLIWLGQLRWWVMIGAMLGIGVATALEWTFVDAPAVVAGVVTVGVVNVFLVVRSRSVSQVTPRELWLHTATDLIALTWMLAWAGGVSNPLIVFYAFHVVLGALLTGRSGTLVGLSGTVLGLATLILLERLGWLPSSVLVDPPESLSVVAIVALVGGLGYFALHLSRRLVTERTVALREKARAENSLELLQGSLDRLSVGLEVRGERGDLLLASPFARRLRKAFELAPLGPASEQELKLDEQHNVGLRLDGEERLFDVVKLRPTEEGSLQATLYVDRTEQRLVQERHFMLERLATLGRALQGVAHELNTPLTTMQTLTKDLTAALAEADLPVQLREDVEESLTILLDESRRCRNLTQSLLSTAHQTGPDGASHRVLDLVRRAVRLVGLKQEGGHLLKLDEASLDVELREGGDRVLQILMNLVQNAIKATEHLEGDRDPVVTVRAEPPTPGRLRIIISNRGPGLPAEVRDRLFEPFVTTRPTGEGTGLGLYTSHRLARELGGELTLVDGPEGGTDAILDLPSG